MNEAQVLLSKSVVECVTSVMLSKTYCEYVSKNPILSSPVLVMPCNPQVKTNSQSADKQEPEILVMPKYGS